MRLLKTKSGSILSPTHHKLCFDMRPTAVALDTRRPLAFETSSTGFIVAFVGAEHAHTWPGNTHAWLPKPVPDHSVAAVFHCFGAWLHFPTPQCLFLNALSEA